MDITREALPRYGDLMLPTLRAVQALGGSGNGGEITAKVLEILNPSDEMLAISYNNRPKSILLDRIEWARSYCKLGGALESPQRGVFRISPLGREIVDLPDPEALDRVMKLDRAVRAERVARRRARGEDQQPADGDDEDQPPEDEDESETNLSAQILDRLHRLSPGAFEEFCMYLLRQYGLELTRTGGPGDKGIDGVGTAAMSAVLSVRVAVQVKRWDPVTVVSRETVASFKHDASAASAERAVFITLGKFSQSARRTAHESPAPTVDLIDGDKLCELIREQRMGLVETVDEAWFARFE